MRRWTRRAWLGAGLGTAASLWLGAVPASSRPAAQAEDPDYPLAARPVADNVYAVLSPYSRQFPNVDNKGWNSNLGFVVTDEGVLVFDTGSSQRIGAALREVIRGVTDQPVRWIVNSHVHGDHWLGNGAFAEDDPAILATPRARERAQAEGQDWVDQFNQLTDGAIGDPARVEPTEAVADRGERSFGQVTAELIPLGHAHSDDDLALWLPEPGILLPGDVVYIDSTPGTFDADIARWLEVHETLTALQPRLVVPGHGKLGDVADLEVQRDYFRVLWEEAERGVEEGRMDYEVLPRVRERLSDEVRAFPNLDDRLGESVSHAYLQAEQAMF